jgi:hypothetical protein
LLQPDGRVTSSPLGGEVFQVVRYRDINIGIFRSLWILR